MSIKAKTVLKRIGEARDNGLLLSKFDYDSQGETATRYLLNYSNLDDYMSQKEFEGVIWFGVTNNYHVRKGSIVAYQAENWDSAAYSEIIFTSPEEKAEFLRNLEHACREDFSKYIAMQRILNQEKLILTDVDREAVTTVFRDNL